jgi:predicted transcriptional regulator
MANRQSNPGDLLEISGFFWKTAALHAAVKLDVFTVIGDGQVAADEIARQLKAAKRGVTRRLDALVAMALLVKRDGNYANSVSGQIFLSKNSSQIYLK